MTRDEVLSAVDPRHWRWCFQEVPLDRPAARRTRRINTWRAPRPDGAQALGVEQGAAKLISLGANSADKEPPRAAMRKQCNLRGNGPADLTGHVEANPALTTRHAGLSRAEPGCEAFEVNPDLANCRKFVLFERYRDEAPCGHVERRPAALDLVRLRRQWCGAGDEIFQRRSVIGSVV